VRAIILELVLVVLVDESLRWILNRCFIRIFYLFINSDMSGSYYSSPLHPPVIRIVLIIPEIVIFHL
jgi:hypothetical protein